MGEAGMMSEGDPQPELGFPIERTRILGRRLIAHLLDGAIYLLITFVPIFAAAAISNVAIAIAVVLWLIPGPVAYYVLTQRASGRSPGKRYANIRVVDGAGRTPTVGALVKRSLLLPLDNTYVLSLISILGSPGLQRLGDRWAKTYVIAVEETG